jgi:putative membrane protein insertion efficiency factor
LVINKIIVRLFLLLIKTYQYIVSPVLTPACRFYPTCSNYAYEALAQHGLTKGGFLALKRVLRCHPFHSGGIDLVP